MSSLRRDWGKALAKCQEEARCRACGRSDLKIDAAHTIGRVHDERHGNTATVNPDSVIPPRRPDHLAYDAHHLDILGVLSLDEQVQAVRDAGGIAAAYRRVTGSRLAA